MKQSIFVTKPSLPSLPDYILLLKEIWKSGRITNKGEMHNRFEQGVSSYLNVNYLSLFTNGTIALITALQALQIKGEVITTPYSFVATTHALHWNGITPVFCDINESDFNINANKIEELITPQTTAIMPVHVYGNPCDNIKIKNIAEKYGLKVINDAAHAFGITLKNESILNWGDLSVLSFHATKTFNTVEGGAIISHNSEMKKKIENLKNFGFIGETEIEGFGINGKMNELIAAYGLLQLDNIKNEISRRKEKAYLYRELLKDIKGIITKKEEEDIRYNYTYFPIIIKKDIFGKSRDEVYTQLKENNIFSRRYFYPLISQFPIYNILPTANENNLPVATKIA